MDPHSWVNTPNLQPGRTPQLNVNRINEQYVYSQVCGKGKKTMRDLTSIIAAFQGWQLQIILIRVPTNGTYNP